MARELKESLLYDFDHNLFVMKMMVPNVRNIQERQIVGRWASFLSKCTKSIDELKLRNDFMYHLVLGVQKDSLKPPFDKPPPKMPFLAMANLLPTVTEKSEHRDLWPTSSGDTLGTNEGGQALARKPEIVRRSPDGGEFLASQPIPDVGAFCYLAVLTKKRN